MSFLAFYLLFFLGVFVLHETGHYVAYRLMGFIPNIKIKWWGVQIGENCYGYMKPGSLYFVSYTGILAGTIPFIIWPFESMALVYLICCAIDINIIFSTTPYMRSKEYKDMSWLKIQKAEIRKWERKYDSAK